MEGEVKDPIKNLKSIQSAKKTKEEMEKNVERNHFYSNTENQLKA